LPKKTGESKSVFRIIYFCGEKSEWIGFSSFQHFCLAIIAITNV
jgi:hypothetical protein